jgi:hypothetical protein
LKNEKKLGCRNREFRVKREERSDKSGKITKEN